MSAIDDFTDAWRALSDAGVSIHPTVTPTISAGIRSLAARLAEAERALWLYSGGASEYFERHKDAAPLRALDQPRATDSADPRESVSNE